MLVRALIIGCGYVGAALGARLVREGHEVVGVRRSVAGTELDAAGIHALAADITVPEHLARLPRAVDWVVHCVASGGGPEDYRRVYWEGARNILSWLADAPPAKFIYTSSTSVYGQNDGSVVTESSPAEPVAETARILASTERLFLDAAGRGFPCVILRVAGIYGRGRGYWLQQFLRGEARIEGDGGRVLNMIHRDDVVGAIVAALNAGRPGEIYNAVDDEPVSQRECLEWIAAAVGAAVPAAAAAPERKRGVTSKRVANQKLKTELGYTFEYPTFRDGWRAEIRRLGLEP